MHIWDACEEVYNEASEARGKFPAFKSAHEGLAVLWEEFEELKVEVFKNQNTRDIDRMRDEARQVGAMAIRFMVDLT